MAEFLEVMKKKNEMCNFYDDCRKCPLCDFECDMRKLEGKLEELGKLEEIIMNWEKPIDWSNVVVDTKILVRGYKDCDWAKRYFAKYENGEVYAFNDGATSWNSIGVTPWTYAKLFEEEE